ncbi:hypothetical protein BH11PLA2_BH11PLA2_23460 [soil metagenome]
MLKVKFFTASALVLIAMTSPAQAAFHLWGISEVYTNSTGSLQFIEFSTGFSSQQFVSGQIIHFRNAANTADVSTLTLPSDLPSDTLNKRFLVGTSGLQAAAGVTPDFIMPNGSLILPSAAISFFGTNSGTYTLPTDGNLSRIWQSGTQVNNPTNFAGVTGHVVVPEPTTLTAGCGLYGLFALLIRRRCSATDIQQPRLDI